MSWEWDWKTTLSRKIAIDEAMTALVELSHELEQELGEPPWSLSRILVAAIEADYENSNSDSISQPSIPEVNLFDMLKTLPNSTLWPMIYTGLANILCSKTWDTENNLDPKVFDAFKLKLEKGEDTIDHHGFKKLIDMENSTKKDVVKALCNTNRISESTMNTILDKIEQADQETSIGAFEVGMEVQRVEKSVKSLNRPGWPPFAKDDETAIIDRIDESDSTLFLRFKENKLWWISCDLVEPTNSSFNL
ncbi:MAG: hypothetical protein CMB54_01780 [Euryarchaeota archaeon]|nr:hypothetical protein [Euryarchaeota archaeon]